MWSRRRLGFHRMLVPAKRRSARRLERQGVILGGLASTESARGDLQVWRLRRCIGRGGLQLEGQLFGRRMRGWELSGGGDGGCEMRGWRTCCWLGRRRGRWGIWPRGRVGRQVGLRRLGLWRRSFLQLVSYYVLFLYLHLTMCVWMHLFACWRNFPKH